MKLDFNSINNTIEAAKSKLAVGRDKGDIADLAGGHYEVNACEIVTPLDKTQRPYAVVTLTGVDEVYFTSTKLTKIVRAVMTLDGVEKDKNGIVHDTFMIAVGTADEFVAPDGKEITYYPIEVIDYED